MSTDPQGNDSDLARGQGYPSGGRPTALTQGKLVQDHDGHLTLMRPSTHERGDRVAATARAQTNNTGSHLGSTRGITGETGPNS